LLRTSACPQQRQETGTSTAERLVMRPVQRSGVIKNKRAIATSARAIAAIPSRGRPHHLDCCVFRLLRFGAAFLLAELLRTRAPRDANMGTYASFRQRCGQYLESPAAPSAYRKVLKSSLRARHFVPKISVFLSFAASLGSLCYHSKRKRARSKTPGRLCACFLTMFAHRTLIVSLL
jgi:hypothetical protein